MSTGFKAARCERDDDYRDRIEAVVIGVLLKSTLVIAAATGTAWCLRRRSAATRNLVWRVGLLAALALPLGSALVPAWEPELGSRIPALARALGGAPAPPALEEAATPEGPEPGLAAAPIDWSLLFGAVWVAGTGIGLLVMLAGTARLGWIAYQAEPFTHLRWQALSKEVRDRIGLGRPVRLLEGHSSSLMGTWGVRTHHVLLPEGAGSWSETRVRMVLAHELSHARRRDWLFQVLAEAARAIYWFNPLFWLAAARIRSESERAADDTVLRLGADGEEYARELVDLARALRSKRPETLPVLGMAHRWRLEPRIAAVLNPSLERLAATPWSVGLIVMVAIGLTLPLAAVRSEAPAVPAEPVAPEPTAADEAAEIPTEPDTAAEPQAELAATVPLGDPCPRSPTTMETPPEGEGAAAALGPGPWYVNEDRTIWVWQQPWSVGDVIRTVWVRPPGQRLVLTGRRLSDERGPDPTPRLSSNITPTDGLAFKTAALRFSAPGCWEVTASAGDEKLVFVTEVEP